MAPSPVLLLLISAFVIIAIYSFTSFTPKNFDGLLGNSAARRSTNSTPPAIFVFGDSTADVGTNPLIPGNLLKSNVPFYGVDFANSEATGRFGNGFITTDFLAQRMGFNCSPLPFLHLIKSRSNFQKNKFTGVNFASAGSGLLNTTFEELRVIPVSEQLNQFIMVRRILIAGMGKAFTKHLIKRSIFLISVGSNDILDYSFTNKTMPREEFIRSLMVAYENNIKILYRLGARKFGVVSVLPMGCVPGQRVLNATGGCIDFMNELSSGFFLELQTLLLKISSRLWNFKYSLGNPYTMTMAVIQNPARYNLTDVTNACCGSGRMNAELPCTPTANLCENRSEYAFFDGAHPTEYGARLVARSLYTSVELQFVSPINIGQLVAS